MVPTFFAYFYRSGLPKYLRTHGDEEKSWALVTGATDGIGLGFAQELCSRGFNVILHGRNPAKLERVTKQLQEEFPDTKLRTFIANASQFAMEDITGFVDQMKDLPITILVNNVGGTGVLDANFKTFDTHSAQEIDDILSLNVRFTIQFTRALMPLLVKNGPSLVLNIGSQASVGMPFMTAYSATKGALHAWSRSLTVEQETYNTGVEVLEILIASVQSQQNQRANATFFVPTSREMARSSLERVGCGMKSVPGYFPHYLELTGYSLMPEGLMYSYAVKFLKPLAGKKERVF